MNTILKLKYRQIEIIKIKILNWYFFKKNTDLV